VKGPSICRCVGSSSGSVNKFDAEVFIDGEAFRDDGKSAATLIPPAFGLAGVSLHTWTGWGSVTHWNAFVANLEMHGKGTFYDPRLNDPAQFPIASRMGFGSDRSDQDLITSKLATLHFYQWAIPSPVPPSRSANGSGAASEVANGKVVFRKQRKNARRVTCRPSSPNQVGICIRRQK
jgi:hypothetical protein